MTRSNRQNALAGVLLLLLAAGCGNAGGAPFGGDVDLSDERWADYGVEPEPRAEANNDRPARDAGGDGEQRGWGERRERVDRPRNERWMPSDTLPSRTERWGGERETASDSLPSRTEPWGGDRSMPSDSMPSQTERWGSERSMPSDSMPSRSGSWGSDRAMPSDSMPSDSWGRDSVFDE